MFGLMHGAEVCGLGGRALIAGGDVNFLEQPGGGIGGGFLYTPGGGEDSALGFILPSYLFACLGVRLPIRRCFGHKFQDPQNDWAQCTCAMLPGERVCRFVVGF